ncbi:DNA cytosine methyltransferase [Hymenobacter metallilatus]|uniref:Cytosine-specific methyltransferase n=1 Tax=Hymenobacter metallilatus TaxID=2493666 RepID=A0A3R9N6P3_9BACT|nr:DNA (cytosine-5-)-methyltransferase [Hymenobacter metallilatus]RSK24926.1 DNA (cytosine-5-)-methyltransferase [Hymenobacter metallilatus]
MKYIDLFAGAGGLSEGFSRAGFEAVAHVEIDYHACNTLKTRQAWYYLKNKGLRHLYDEYLRSGKSPEELYALVPPEITNSVIHAEISEKTTPGIFQLIDQKLGPDERVDLIVGGPPCQTFSVAGRARLGRQAMEDDPRSRLYIQYAGFLAHYQPRMFVFENVLGLQSFRQRNQLDHIRDTFREAGYDMAVHKWNARDFGVLQSRERLIIIGWRHDQHQELGYPDLQPDYKHNFRVWDLLRDLPPLRPGEKDNRRYKSAPTPYLQRFGLRDENQILTWHESRAHRPVDLEIYAKAIQVWDREARQLRYPDDLDAHQISHKNVTGFKDRFKVVAGEKPFSQTVVAHIHKDGHYYIHPDAGQCRSLSVREAARLQSFPDNYYFEGPRGSAYKQIGNAVPPLMAERIARRVKAALQGKLKGQFLPSEPAASKQLQLDYSLAD